MVRGRPKEARGISAIMPCYPAYKKGILLHSVGRHGLRGRKGVSAKKFQASQEVSFARNEARLGGREKAKLGGRRSARVFGVEREN